MPARHIPLLSGARLLLPALALPLFAAPEVHAAGGAHIVDDAAVGTPGACSTEAWASAMSGGSAQIDATAACTPRALPWLEAGIWVQRTWTRDGDDTQAGPSVKLAALRLGRGVSVGVAAWGGWSGATDRIESAGAIIPLTIALDGGVTLNINAGWEWGRTDNRHKPIVGGQIDWAVTSSLSLMAEVYTQIGTDAGYQAGIRWTPAPWIDVDLIAGRLSDGAARHAATLGVTVRY